jgi:hypothetical protein
MTRRLLGGTLAFGLLVCSIQPATAGGALIETTAPLADHSQASVKAAVIAAIDKAVRGAAAMGFAWFQLRDAQVSGDQVAVQILASDEGPGNVAEIDPGEAPDAMQDDEDLAEQQPSPEPPVPAISRVNI